MIPFLSYGSKRDLLRTFAAGWHVLHIGAVGCTLQEPEEKLRAAATSVHAFLSRVSTCVGVEIDQEVVATLTEAGIFTNLIAADVRRLSREDVALPSIDVIVAGDVIEHLSDPGIMLDRLHSLSDPGTRLIVTTPNAFGIPNFMRYVIGRWSDGPDHVCCFNADTLVNMLHRHGWVIDEMHTCYQAGAERRTARAAFWLGKHALQRMPRFGGTLFAVAHKSPQVER